MRGQGETDWVVSPVRRVRPYPTLGRYEAQAVMGAFLVGGGALVEGRDVGCGRWSVVSGQRSLCFGGHSGSGHSGTQPCTGLLLVGRLRNCSINWHPFLDSSHFPFFLANDFFSWWNRNRWLLHPRWIRWPRPPQTTGRRGALSLGYPFPAIPVCHATFMPTANMMRTALPVESRWPR